LQTRLVYWYATGLQRFDLRFVVINANHFVADFCKTCPCDQPNVACADNCKIHCVIKYSPQAATHSFSNGSFIDSATPERGMRSQRFCSLNGTRLVEGVFVVAGLFVKGAALVGCGNRICGTVCGASGVIAAGAGANSSGCFILNSSNLIPASEP